MNRAKLLVFGSIAVLTVLLAVATVYAYGKWFSHNRYWHGTIERVQVRQAALARSFLTSGAAVGTLPERREALAEMFAPFDGVMAVEVHRHDDLRYSNVVDRFIRGKTLDVIEMQGGWRVSVIAYQPPTWEKSFVRWLSRPGRWLEPSFDYITMPFLWFMAIYSLGLLVLGLAVKSSYLERDVLVALDRLDRRCRG